MFDWELGKYVLFCFHQCYASWTHEFLFYIRKGKISEWLIQTDNDSYVHINMYYTKITIYTAKVL